MRLTMMKVISRRLLLIMAIAAITAMSAGCVSLSSMQKESWEKTRVIMGINKEAPHIAAINSYGTSDPELLIFLLYMGALSKGIVVTSGNDMDASVFEDMLKNAENDMRRVDISTMSEDEKLAQAEKGMDGVRRGGAPKYLKTLPVGADPKMSYLLSSSGIYPETAGDTLRLNQKTTVVSIGYKFKNLEEMSKKAQDLSNKLRPVIEGQHGWKTMDLAAYKAQVYDNRTLEGSNLSPEYKRKYAEQIEKNFKAFQAGQVTMNYTYESHLKTSYIPALNQYIVTVGPVMEPVNGYYELYVILTTAIAEPRKDV